MAEARCGPVLPSGNASRKIALRLRSCFDFGRTLFSLPRDFYVKYPESGYGRINGVYERYILEGEEVAMQKLSETISMITGKKIDFYDNIVFQGFIEIVDALG